MSDCFFTSVYENAIFVSFALATDNKKELTSCKRLTTGKNEKFSWETDLWVTLGDFTVKNAKLEREIYI